MSKENIEMFYVVFIFTHKELLGKGVVINSAVSKEHESNKKSRMTMLLSLTLYYECSNIYFQL